MRALFGDLLPARLLERTTKAGTSRAYEGPRTAEFVERWNGEGVDPDLVDPEELRRAWRPGDGQNGRAILQLQAAWLAGRRS
jgi:asparagine synthase (glutamine-hydrolysing)